MLWKKKLLILILTSAKKNLLYLLVHRLFLIKGLWFVAEISKSIQPLELEIRK